MSWMVIASNLPEYIRDNTLYRSGERCVLVVSYDAVLTRGSETLTERRKSETLAYEADVSGNIVNPIPLLVTQGVRNHSKFVLEL